MFIMLIKYNDDTVHCTVKRMFVCYVGGNAGIHHQE